MTMDPFRERALDLLIDKQAILLIRGVQRNPSKRSHPQNNARSFANAAGLADDAHWRECGREQR